MAMRASLVRIHKTIDRDKVFGLIPGDSRADFPDTTQDFVARRDRIFRRTELAPLVSDRVQIGVADDAEEDPNPDVMFSRISPRDRGSCELRCRTFGGTGVGPVHGLRFFNFEYWAGERISIRQAGASIDSMRTSFLFTNS